MASKGSSHLLWIFLSVCSFRLMPSPWGNIDARIMKLWWKMRSVAFVLRIHYSGAYWYQLNIISYIQLYSRNACLSTTYPWKKKCSILKSRVFILWSIINWNWDWVSLIFGMLKTFQESVKTNHGKYIQITASHAIICTLYCLNLKLCSARSASKTRYQSQSEKWDRGYAFYVR